MAGSLVDVSKTVLKTQKKAPEAKECPQHVFGEIRNAYLSISVVHCEVEEDAVDGEHILEMEGGDELGDGEPYWGGQWLQVHCLWVEERTA
jgi:hypothetical protein